MKERGEKVWPRFFNGVQWLEGAPGDEEEDIEESWLDFVDDSILSKLRRGHAVAESLEDGDFFAVYMLAAAGQRHEKTGWCIYQMVGDVEVLTDDKCLEERCTRGEHTLEAGETVVTGRPLVCGKLDHGQRVYSYELLP